ncbi:MAG: Hsp70 family protein, partial [Candidatus Aenigmarchaeota archaeon]|nr:Hsp70 family protein [Candidatus Aenigmarchaeota archaeon]
FSTASDSQNAVTINVVQGERPMSADNTSLGTFNLVGIPPAPRGVPQIEVEFDIDANGILDVSAKDKGTGTEQKITISASTKMPKEDIENLVKEAEKFAEDDKKKKEEVEIKNSAESMAYTAEKTLSDLGDKIPSDKKKNIEASMKSLKDIMGSEDTTKIKAETESLGKVLQEVGASMYQQSEAPKETAADSGEKKKESKDEKKPEEKVVDAEYKVDDEKKE